jgi:protein O-mannosyl-transferase
VKHNHIAGETKLYQYSALFVVLIPFMLYISALRLGFVYFDDDILVLDNYEKISHLSNLGQAFRSDAFFARMCPYYRPLMNVSYMVDAAIGGKSPMIYHFSNMVYHLLNCLSLLWLLTLMGFSKPKILIGTLIFAVHPMMGHAVLWIPARGDLLVTLFALLSISHLILFHRDNKPYQLIIHLFCFAGAIFSKESAVYLPVLFFLWLIIKKLKIFSLKNVILVSFWLLILSFWYFLRLISVDQRDDGQVGFRALFQNIFFLPETVARFFFPFVSPVTPVFSSMYTLAGIVAMIVIVVFIFKLNIRNKLPVILFGAAWFVGFCFPNMLVRLVAAGDSFEYLPHRTYLPYIGLLILLLAALPQKWFEIKNRGSQILIGLILFLFSFASVAQQKNYLDAMSYWGSAIRYSPGKAWFHYYLGRYYFKNKDYARFEQYLLTADSLKSYPEFKYHLAMVAFLDKKDYEKAYSYFSQAFGMGYGNAEARANYVNLCIESSSYFFQKGSYIQAIERCEEALNNDPSNGVAAYNLGIYLINTGEKQRAASMWYQAIRFKPDLTDAYRSLCLYYQYDVKKADSAAWFAREFNNHGGTGNLISPQQK